MSTKSLSQTQFLYCSALASDEVTLCMYPVGSAGPGASLVAKLGLDGVVELDDGTEDVGERHDGDGLSRWVDHVGTVQSSVVAVGREVTACRGIRGFR